MERGVDNYWLVAYKPLKHDFIILKENFDLRDNKLLTAIEAQNEGLKSQLLEKRIPTKFSQPLPRRKNQQSRRAICCKSLQKKAERVNLPDKFSIDGSNRCKVETILTRKDSLPLTLYQFSSKTG